MRIAETRAVNRALRKAYGVGLCSAEELGSSPQPPAPAGASRVSSESFNKLELVPKQSLRDQLRQLIRTHKLDPASTKSYALEHLHLESLRDATPDQVKELIEHLQRRLFEDRVGVLEDLAKFTGVDRKGVA
jgi:hypothetical protein